MSQPLNLECIDRSPYLHGLCEKGERYYLTDIRSWGAGLAVGCFLRDAGEPAADDGGSDPAGVVAVRGGERGGSAGGAAAAGEGGGAVADSTGRVEPRRVCSPPVPIDDLALVFAPIEEERRPNKPDLCGFYFFPYALAETISAHGQGAFEVDDMEVVWSAASYAANAADHPEKDYSLLRADTHKQDSVRIASPFIREAAEARAARER